MRWGLTAVVLITGLSAAAPPPESGAEPPSGEQMVDALHGIFGEHHARAAHAKGLMLTGSFIPSAGAAALSKAGLFRVRSAPVLARLSDTTGLPAIPDTSPDATPHGLALKISLPSGDEMNIVTHSANGFPARNAADFRQFLLAVGASKAGTPKPTPLDTWLAGHPETVRFVTSQKPPPASLGTLTYFGVNAFRLTNAAGKSIIVRWRLVPVAGETLLDAAAVKTRGPDYLMQELPARLARGPISFRWLAQVAEAGDAADDPSTAWPEDRRLIELGTIRLTAVARGGAAGGAVDKATIFQPGVVPDGIAPADPMIEVRDATYPVSFSGRQ